MTGTTLYLRLSDFRDDSDGFSAREARLRSEAARLGWDVDRVVVENDVMPKPRNGNGRARPASAFKRVPVRDKAGNKVRDKDTGRYVMRVYRPGWQSVVADLAAGRTGAVLCEDLDRACRDPRDLEDLVDAVAATGASARSVSGSLTLTNGGTDSEVTMARVMVTMGNKSSRDTARRVKAKRGDLAAAGAYGGGTRPFGFRPDPDAPKYKKTLLLVPSEAAEIRKAATAIMAKTTLKAIARDLREGGVPTVTGAQWTPSTLRDVLTKPAIAGLAVSGGKLVKASWAPILGREEWEAMCAVLTDTTMVVTLPDGTQQTRPRKTTTGNEPRHLLSGIAVCHCGGAVKASGSGKARQAVGYTCVNYDVRRHAAKTDEWVEAHITEYLNREDNKDLLRPPSRPGVDAGALRDEARNLTLIGKRQARMHALGEMTDAEYREGAMARKERLDAIASRLATTTETDPLSEFRDQPDAAVVWESLSLPRKRAVARLLVSVTLLPSQHKGRGFDSASVRVEPRTP